MEKRVSPRMGHACVDSRKGGRRLRDYEILFILPPDLEEEEATATTERVRASVVSRGGEVKSLEVWGDADSRIPSSATRRACITSVGFRLVQNKRWIWIEAFVSANRSC